MTDTRERILETALALFNDAGEPHVTTNRIAGELGISPGNLHYHFRTKQTLIEALFGRFERRMLELLSVSSGPGADLEDIWLFLHLVFETIGEYRFLYRDLTDLCGRFRGIHQRFRGILKLSGDTARELAMELRETGQLQASPQEIEGLVRNVVLVSSFWLAFDTINDDHHAQPQPDRAAWQVLSLLSPYLEPDSRRWLNRLAREYLHP